RETRSGAFWPFWGLIEALDREGRGPRLLVIENVLGLASSRGGDDLAALAKAIAASGRHFAALAIDGALFTPQSRPRLFVVAWDARLTPAIAAAAPPGRWTPPPLRRALERLPPSAAAAHHPLDPTPPKAPPPPLATLLEPAPPDVRWRSEEQVAKLLAMMAPAHRDRVEAAKRRAAASGETQAGALYRRTREDGEGGRVQRAEIRFDLAGCLRTPAGGSSRQTLLLIEPGGHIRARLFSAREVARLMGLPDHYRLPNSYTDAYKLAGDGVVVGAARFLGEQILLPLLSSGSIVITNR
ncbi:MAG: DNA cytosine methyltransferase, partial [Rhodobacteraceae bacterium]|nr:DNA cytosine methyltransferase [Paracoccaceae bacterium]